MGPEIAIQTFAFLGTVICISIVLVKYFVIRAQSAERHALIEKGMKLTSHLPSVAELRQLSRIRWIRIAFLGIGLGVGALGSQFINGLIWDTSAHRSFPPRFMNLVFTMISGGLAIILYYRLEPDYIDPVDPQPNETHDPE